MSRAWLVLTGLALGVMASQAGHRVAYQLRFDVGASQVHTSG